MQNIQSFFTTWLVILILNQIFIFHGCFSPHCLLAALPHTGIIAYLINIFILKDEERIEHEVNSTEMKGFDFGSQIASTKKEAIKKVFPKNINRETSESSFLDKYQKNPKNNNAYLNTREFEKFKKMSYKDIPIEDQRTYEGVIKYRYDNNLILLQIKHVGKYKIKLPARKNWDLLKVNKEFVFYREKYSGTGKNSAMQYAKLIIVQ